MTNPALDSDYKDDLPDTGEAEPRISKIQLLKDGPILIHGAISFIREGEGEAYEQGAPPIALCRCGNSSNKPFCDGEHQHTYDITGPLPEGEIE